MIAPLVLLSVLAAQGAQPTPPAPPTPPQIGVRSQTTQTVSVTKGTRLEINQCAGDVNVTTWDRDQVRVLATHTRRTTVRVEPRGEVLVVDTQGSGGRGSADFELTVPAWINLHVQGRECYVEVEGVTGGVNVRTNESDIILRNVAGGIVARTIEGKISLDGARGRAEVNTVEGDVLVSRSQGELSVESVDGSITITESQLSAIEVSTVDGDIVFTGALQASGRYLFITHDGDVSLGIPENTSATFGIRASESQRIGSSLPLKQTSAAARGRRTVYTLGGGSAQVEIESFDGEVHIGRTGQGQKD